MKKSFVLILALALTLSLAGCNGIPKFGGNSTSNVTSSPATGGGTASPSATQNSSTAAANNNTATSGAGSNATASAATGQNYELAFGYSAGDGPAFPANVSWNGATSELKVSYINPSNYFPLSDSDMSKPQGTQLFKKDASGAYQPVSGVTAKIASTGDMRGDSNYGTVLLKFYSGNAPYTLESGASYAVLLDIIVNGDYHHSTPKGDPMFEFSGGAAGTASPSASAGASAKLTLAALKQAGISKGFTDAQSMSADNTAGNPTPKGGFDLGVMNGGTLSIVVTVLEFATPADAQKYDNFIKNQDGVVIHTHTSGAFYVEFQKDAYDKESDLMAAFAALGWAG